ncbi:MAG TPA: hypothetical protein VK902_13070 [Rubrobacter sp.]|nr:hypothetical protein [Rubrobacter sp.]
MREFRTTHPPKRVTVDGVGWEYIASGGGEEDLLARSSAPSSDGVTPGLGSTRSAAPGILPG